MFSTLSGSDKKEFSDDYTKAMLNNPDLMQEQQDLMKRGFSMRGTHPSAADRQAFHDAWKAYLTKLRAAIVSVDLNVEPILMRLDKQREKMRADFQAAHPGASMP
jgi:hypothetical protein